MNRLFYIGSILLVLATFGSAQGQNTTPEQREEFFRGQINKAKWTLVTIGPRKQPYYVDSNTMTRIVSSVVFLLKTEKRGTIEYDKVIGGCTKDLFSLSISFTKNPGSETLLGGEIQDPEMITVSENTPPYKILDYVCKNAKVMSLDK